MTSSFKAFFWNARGVANPATQRYIAQLCRTHHPHIVCIAEPWTWTHLVQDFWSALGLKLLAVNNRDNLAPNLWFFCAAHISATLISSSAQQVSVSLMIQNTPCLFSAIYASTAVFSRRQLWRDLQLLNFQGPWCCIGDFNAVLGAHEKVGGRPPPLFHARIFCPLQMMRIFSIFLRLALSLLGPMVVVVVIVFSSV